jgi:spore maturation protein SpmB
VIKIVFALAGAGVVRLSFVVAVTVATLSAAAAAEAVTAERTFVRALATVWARPRSGVAALESGMGVSLADAGGCDSSGLRVEDDEAGSMEEVVVVVAVPLLGRPLI